MYGHSFFITLLNINSSLNSWRTSTYEPFRYTMIVTI